MPRYVTRAWSGDDVYETSHHLNDEASYERALTVFEANRDPVDTGVLDRHGNRVFRVEDDRPFGFFTGR